MWVTSDFCCGVRKFSSMESPATSITSWNNAILKLRNNSKPWSLVLCQNMIVFYFTLSNVTPLKAASGICVITNP